MSVQFARLTFADGEVGASIIDAMVAEDHPLRTAGIAMAQAMADVWDTGEYHDVHDTPSRGTFDHVVVVGPYYLTFHPGLHHIGMERTIDADTGSADTHPYCSVCGEWIDYCQGGHDEGDYAEIQRMVDKFTLMLTDGGEKPQSPPPTPRYGWRDFEFDDSTDQVPDKYILTITQDEEELAIIVHRTVGDRYPLDGYVAEAKRANARRIVMLLNAAEGQR